MTASPLKIGFDKEGFTAYMKKVNPRMFTHPITKERTPILGVTLHNTYFPTLAMVIDYMDKNIGATKEWTAEQLIDNWWVNYIHMKWVSGPHIFVFPHKIYVACPLDMRGTHSPSYNKNYWGIEVVGDYAKEKLPDQIRDMTRHVAKTMFNQLAVKASDHNFRFHGEDPRTTHKLCPGVNIGTKASWIASINAA